MGVELGVGKTVGPPEVIWNPVDKRYLVVWEEEFGRGYYDKAIFGQLLTTLGEEWGQSSFPISATMAQETRFPVVGLSLEEQVYLVVWGEPSDSSIRGQLVPADGIVSGLENFIISSSKPGAYPSVAWNSTHHEFMVVWTHQLKTIYGRRVSPEGVLLGDTNIPISDEGSQSRTVAATDPLVYWNGKSQEYLVIWSGTNSEYSMGEGENEILGQRLSGDGDEIGFNDFRITDSPEGYRATVPDLEWNEVIDEYFLVWQAKTIDGVESIRVIAQRLNELAQPVGERNIEVSHRSLDEIYDYDALAPSVSYSDVNREYLVFWSGDDLEGSDFEIYGHRVKENGTLESTEELRISDMGPDGDLNLSAFRPSSAWNPENQEFLVTWVGDDQLNWDFEIHGQRLGYYPVSGPSSYTPTPTPSVTYTPTVLPTPSSTPTPSLKSGDINHDGEVNGKDLLFLLQEWRQ